MPVQFDWINQRINELRLEKNIKDRDGYTPSGKLSAGSLYLPTRFQVLKTLGVPREEFDAYTLGVFDKGNKVEDEFLADLEAINIKRKEDGLPEFMVTDKKLLEGMYLEWDEDKKQYKSTYRECIGYVDSIINITGIKPYPDFGVIPCEVKSVTSYKYKHLKKGGSADWHHCLQACQNALGMGVEHFAIVYISKEHPDPHLMIYQVREYKRDVDHIISNYMQAMENWKKDRSLPKMELDDRVKWLVPNYSPFEKFWYQAPDSEVIKELERLKLI